jgi:hypothetical protein
MKRIILFFAPVLMLTIAAQAQKKLVAVSQSALTGIELPAGSKKDGRFLSEISGKALLEMESKKVNTAIKNIEVLSLPAANLSGFTSDSLVTRFSSLGWNIIPVENDNKYVWLQKDSRFIITYFSMNKNSTELYFGEANTTPDITVAVNNTQPVQTADVQPTNPQTQTNPQTDIQQPANTVNDIVNPTPVTQTGFAYNTTNFNEGWTSSIYDDYVLSTKGDIKVYLSYVEKFNASDYSGTGKQIRFNYWDNYVSKYFITGEKKFDNRGVLSDFSQDYMEGPATDKQTGEKRYIAMIIRIIPYTGTLSIIIASAPGEQQLRTQFPKADGKFDNDLLPMYGFNKFAVGKNDLIGKWSSGGNGASVSWYSATTGNQVGSTAAVTSDVFTFINGSSYTSTHNGASGWVGAMNTFQQKYKGTYTVTDWTVTATNRWDGKTEKFDAWFEIVKGGRILHMDIGPTTMALFKEK